MNSYRHTPMDIQNLCSRARLLALISRKAHYVALVNGQPSVTADPASTTSIQYTATFPANAFPFQKS